MKSILKATESITGKQEASLYVSTIGLEEQQKPLSVHMACLCIRFFIVQPEAEN